MDTRIDPRTVLGLAIGDAKILRNAGARVTDDVLRGLILAVHLLGVSRIALIHHTGCAVVGSSDEALRAQVEEASRTDAAATSFLAVPDPATAVRHDRAVIAACPLLPDDLVVGGFVLDLDTGELRTLDA